MKLSSRIAIGIAALGLPLAAYAAVQGTDEDEASEAAELANAPTPKIDEARARQIALTVAKGTVAEAEYEKEDGSWRWSFDIRESGRIHEIGVDAMTGQIAEDSWESSDND